jgi:hypothetical protein
MLNEAFDTFSHVIEIADTEPTRAQRDVFQHLSGRLDEQLKKWTQIKSDDVPKVDALIRQADVPALSVSAGAEPQK